MTAESPTKICPRCHSVIADDAPGGLCPRCLMQFVAMSTGGTDLAADDRSPPDLDSVQAAFPHLEILELVGQGGMGAVFKARQTKLDRLVALKILPQRLAREPLFAERFAREGRLLARLNHPNIVGVHDFGQADGYYYLMMEYVDGVNLRQALATGQFTPQQSLSIIPKICEALQYAHDEGVLHRDIKPENVLMDTKGRVKIADFGIAKFSGVDDKTGLTATGATIGTPHYMAPEQIEMPADVDHRADIFSLGVVFYEMLTGELPLGRFAAPSERRDSLDVRIDDVVMRALEKDRERRQQSASEVRTQVESLNRSSTDNNHAAMDKSAGKVPLLAAREQKPRYALRPKIALALIMASIILPTAMTFYLKAPAAQMVGQLAMTAAWFGIPGTILGVLHLQYLGKSGQRYGLWPAVLASTFWLFALALTTVFILAMAVLQEVHNWNSTAIEPIEVTVVLVIGLAITVWCVRRLHRWIQLTPPEPESASSTNRLSSKTRFAWQVFAGSLWILFGLGIILLAPVGTLEKILLALILLGVAVMAIWSIKGWIETTSPAAVVELPKHPVDKAVHNLVKGLAVAIWVGLLLTTIVMIPKAQSTTLPPMRVLPSDGVANSTIYLDIVSLSTHENVLTMDVMNNNRSMEGTMGVMGDGMPEGMAESMMSMGVGMDVGQSMGMGMGMEEMLSQVDGGLETGFQVIFQGQKLLPEAVVSASEHYQGACFFPGEPSEPLRMDLRAGKKTTLGFAFPDAKTAMACKLRLDRQIQSGQWPMPLELDGIRKLLFQVHSVYGEYSVSVESLR